MIIWKQLQGGIFELYELVPGFILASVAIVIVSLLDKAPSKEIIEEYEKIEASIL